MTVGASNRGFFIVVVYSLLISGPPFQNPKSTATQARYKGAGSADVRNGSSSTKRMEAHDLGQYRHSTWLFDCSSMV